jgi:hypothetical protein
MLEFGAKTLIRMFAKTIMVWAGERCTPLRLKSGSKRRFAMRIMTNQLVNCETNTKMSLAPR